MIYTFFQYADMYIVNTLDLFLSCIVLVTAMGALLMMLCLMGAIAFAPALIAKLDCSPNLPAVIMCNIIAIVSMVSSNTIVVACGIIIWIVLLILNILPWHKQ